LTPACAGLLESRGSRLGLLKSTFDAENFYAGCLGLSLAISVQFTLEMRVTAQNCEKFTKTPIFRVKGQSKSSILTIVRNSTPVLVMVSSMSVPICNHFHVREANSGRITSF